MSSLDAPRPSAWKGVLARPWLLIFVPANAASSGFSVALPLLILFTLHGNVLDVALATSLYNAAVIPAALLWGVVCDRWGVRSPLLFLNYAAYAGVFLLLALLPSLGTLLLVYSLFGLVAPSSAAASNLLILERFTPAERPTAYASFSELSMIGGVLGILAGVIWTVAAPGGLGLLNMLYVMAALSMVSALGVAFFVRDAPTQHRRAHLARHPESLVSRLGSLIPYFPHLPSRGFFRRAGRWLREEATHEVPLMLAGGFLFNLAANLFNTSYTPYLTSAGLGATGVFLVNLANNGAQAVVLPFTGRACEAGRSERVVLLFSWVRAGGYALVGLFALLPLSWWAGGAALAPNIFAYALLGIAIAFYGTASSLLLFRSLEGRSAGSLLGASSALGGLAAVLGAAASGSMSHDLGFKVTFTVSAVAMMATVLTWSAAVRAYHARRREGGAPLRPAAPAPY